MEARYENLRLAVLNNLICPHAQSRLTSDPSRSTCGQRLQSVFSDLQLQYQYRPSILTGVGFAKENVWSRSARRKIKHGDLPDAGGNSAEDAALGFKIQLRGSGSAGTEVKVRWLQGKDSVLFESFCGMLKRQMSL